MNRELLQQALDALDIAFNYEGDVFGLHHNDVVDTVAELKAELEKPEPEPVAYRHGFDGYGYLYIDSGSGSLWRSRAPLDADFLYLKGTTNG